MNGPDVRVEPLDASGQPLPPSRRPSDDTIINGGAPRLLRDRLARLPMVRRLTARPVPRGVVAAVAAIASAAVVTIYMDRPVGPVPVEPQLFRPIVTAETWLDADPVPVHDPISASGLPADDWQRVVAAHPTNAIVALAISTQPRLFGLPPGQFEVRASCEVAEPRTGVRPQLALWVRLAATPGDDHITVTCGTGSRPVMVLDVHDYQAFEALYFPIPDPSQGEHGGQEPTGQLVVISFAPVS